MTAQTQLSPTFFVEKLISDTEKNQINPVRQYFSRQSGKIVVLGAVEPLKNYISKIERCLSNIQAQLEPLSKDTPKHLIYDQYIECAESVHELLYDSGIVEFLNLGESAADLSQDIPAYIFENPNTSEDPDEFVKKIIQERRGGTVQSVKIGDLRDEVIKSFTSCERKSKEVATNASSGVGAVVGGGILAGAMVATGPIGWLVGAGIAVGCGVAAKKGSKIVADDITSNWYQSLIQSFRDFLEKPQKNSITLRVALFKKDTHEHVKEIKTDILSWVTKTKDKLNFAKNYELHIDILALQLEQLWSLAKAVLTQKPESIQEHSLQFQMLKDATERLKPNAQLVMSVGYNTQNGQKVQVMKWCRVIDLINKTTGRWTNSNATSNDFSEVVKEYLGKYNELQKQDIGGIFIGDFTLKQLRSNVLNEKFNKYYPIDSEQASIAGNFELAKWTGALDDEYGRGGKPYYCPNGWHRISLNVARDRAEFDRKYADWPIAYHGTEGKLALDILVSGLRSGEGVLFHENKWKWQKGLVYLSPSIIYTAHPR